MKYNYPGTVDAVYTASAKSDENPFIEAMPESLTKEKLFQRIRSFPQYPDNLPMLPAKERRELVPLLSSIFLPMDYMYRLYDAAYRAMISTYTTMTTKESIKQLNGLYLTKFGKELTTHYTTQCECCAMLGVPGIGKTSSFRRCMSTMPQVISHTTYREKPFFCKQVTYLFVECPSDCSVKTLTANVARALDNAVGTHYVDSRIMPKSLSAGAAALMLKQLCINHHVGLLIIDEIQNAVLTAHVAHQTSRLIKFLVELMNDTATSVFLIGTMEAEEMFLKEEHLRRRTRGARLLPMKHDAVFRGFLETLWAYQFVAKPSQLTDRLMDLFYEYSGGIPAYLIKLYQESQVQAILSGEEIMDEAIIRKTVKLLAIEPPKKYYDGVNISEIRIEESSQEELPIIENRRGRKAEQRDELDILQIAESVGSLQELKDRLQQIGLLEDLRC